MATELGGRLAHVHLADGTGAPSGPLVAGVRPGAPVPRRRAGGPGVISLPWQARSSPWRPPAPRPTRRRYPPFR
jgi:hypothetical protein